MSRLLVNELSSLLSAFSFVYALSAYLRSDVDCFGSMYIMFLFSFCTLFVLLFLVLLEVSVVLLEDSLDLESAIHSVCIDIVFALVLEVLLCGV